jgi:hypothetical protein
MGSGGTGQETATWLYFLQPKSRAQMIENFFIASSFLDAEGLFSLPFPLLRLGDLPRFLIHCIGFLVAAMTVEIPTVITKRMQTKPADLMVIQIAFQFFLTPTTYPLRSRMAKHGSPLDMDGFSGSASQYLTVHAPIIRRFMFT